jgi:hypothetical protein
MSGCTGEGAAVLLLPIDRLLWTERTAGIATEFARAPRKPPAVQPLEVWLTRDASDRARDGLQQPGITLVERVGQRLPLLDEDNALTQATRVPSASGR